MTNLAAKAPSLEGVKYTTNSAGKLISAVVTLDFPLNELNPPIDKLKFRRMKAKDALAGEGYDDEAEAGYAVFAKLGGVPIETIGELDVEDLERVGKAIAPLMGKLAAAAMKEGTESLSGGET